MGDQAEVVEDRCLVPDVAELLEDRQGKLAVPVLAVVTALGIVLLASRTLWA